MIVVWSKIIVYRRFIWWIILHSKLVSVFLRCTSVFIVRLHRIIQRITKWIDGILIHIAISILSWPFFGCDLEIYRSCLLLANLHKNNWWAVNDTLEHSDHANNKEYCENTNLKGTLLLLLLCCKVICDYFTRCTASTALSYLICLT